MKDKTLIYRGDPCTMCLDTPETQTLEDAKAEGARHCRYYAHRNECSPPAFGCVQVAGLKLARYVLLFYSEASEKTLEMESAVFSKRAPLPPEGAEAYIDTPDYGYRHITDAELVVQRVREYARAVLDLKPGERVFRSLEEPAPPTPDLSKAREEPAAEVEARQISDLRVPLG